MLPDVDGDRSNVRVVVQEPQVCCEVSFAVWEAGEGAQPFMGSSVTSSTGELYLPSKCGQTVSSQQGGVLRSTHHTEQLGWILVC